MSRPAGTPPSTAKPRSLGPLSDLLGFRLRRIQNHLSHGLRQRPDFDGAKPGELSILAILQANLGLSQVELSEEVGLDKAMIVTLIDDLERRGLVRRERAVDDRRRNQLFVTPHGDAVLDRWLVAAHQNERAVRDALTPQEFDVLSQMLDRIYNECFNHVEI
jgi:DNA-binding MarR family transcriptional regulator